MLDMTKKTIWRKMPHVLYAIFVLIAHTFDSDYMFVADFFTLFAVVYVYGPVADYDVVSPYLGEYFLARENFMWL